MESDSRENTNSAKREKLVYTLREKLKAKDTILKQQVLEQSKLESEAKLHRERCVAVEQQLEQFRSNCEVTALSIRISKKTVTSQRRQAHLLTKKLSANDLTKQYSAFRILWGSRMPLTDRVRSGPHFLRTLQSR